MSQKKRGSKAQQREAVANTNHIKEACRILGSESLATFKDVAYEAACVSARKNVKTAASTISGPGKRAARQFADALHRMEIALKNPYLAHDLRAGLLLDVAGVQGLRALAQEAAKRDLSMLSFRDHGKREAAERSGRLLIAHGFPLTTTHKTSAWCRLAALLYGEPDHDFYHHCCAVKDKLLK